MVRTSIRTSFRQFAAAATAFGALLAGTPALRAATTAAPTYSESVAPIFFAHCAQCHRPNGAGPMSLLSYAEARPWAKSVAKAVRAGDMPPWSGESDRLHFRNDLRLSPDQVQTIVRWAEAGAPEGDPARLPPVPHFPEGWTLGEPDYVINLSEVSVPAAGPDVFPQEWLSVDIPEPRWIRAIEFLPSDRRVAHHMQTTYNSPERAGRPIGDQSRQSNAGSGVLAIWTAGMPPYVFPEGMGRVINPGTRVLVDSHYHPFGEATKDTTRIGLYFGAGELRKEVATLFAVNTGMRIPPGAAAHPELAFHSFERDAQILAFSPHMHLRGKAMRYVLNYPDGRKETLLDVPRYNYNWQWLYYPTQPVDVPAGSRLDVTAVWDNSAGNPANPDPSKEIIYRGDTFNEMFVAFIEVIPKEGVHHLAKPNLERIADLLQPHPAESSFVVGGFLPFGLYVPKQGEGWLYLVQGATMFTNSLDDIHWEGNKLRVVTQFPTPEASGTTAVIEGEVDEQGRLQGMFRYGIDSPKPLEVPLLGQPMTARAAAVATGVGSR